MIAPSATPATESNSVDDRPWTRRIRHGWLVETALGIALYFIYDELRSRVSGSATVALAHGYDIVHIERALGLYQEHRVQQALIGWPAFLSFWNIYYGTIHFVLPVVALVVLWRTAPARYVRWRNTLLLMLTFGLLGFWLYPLMPPRLMPHRFGFVDTAAEYFNFGPQQRVVLRHGIPTAASRAAFGNLFAAMPSLHAGWSMWSALALAPLVRRPGLRVGGQRDCQNELPIGIALRRDIGGNRLAANENCVHKSKKKPKLIPRLRGSNFGCEITLRHYGAFLEKSIPNA